MYFLLLLLFALPQAADSFCLPENFALYKESHKFGLKYAIETEEGIIGTIHRKLHFRSYELVDKNGLLLAYTERTSSGEINRFEIKDGEGGLIGFFEEPDYFAIPAFYLLSHDGEVLAKGQSNFFRTRFFVIDPETEIPIAKLSRDYFDAQDAWSACIYIPEFVQEDHIDPRLFVLMMALESDAETWRAD